MSARLDKATLISDPLRREAEQKWADSDQTAAKRARRGRARARARTRRQEVAKEQGQEIARLKGKLERTERELAQHRRRRGKGKESGK
jgi:hypothetical protein